MSNTAYGLIALLLIPVAWLAIQLTASRSRITRLRRLSELRRGYVTFESFRGAFPACPEPIIRETYVLVQRLIDVENFPLEPGDELAATLGIEQGEFDGALAEMFASRPGSLDFVRTRAKPTRTVRDLIVLIQEATEMEPAVRGFASAV